MVAFTGSQATGRDIMRRASATVKRLVMELGGNDPMIVLKDADLERAARFAVAGGFENSGQMCTSIERVYVHEDVAAEFEEKVAHIASRYKVGPWNETNVNIGPIINAKQHAKIMDHILDAEQKGGRFLVGHGSEKEDDDRYKPPYISPTVIADMTPDMKLEREETFGPVIGIATFANIQEAIDRANDSDYGLGAVVFGHEEAQDVAAQLEAGMVGINQGQGSAGGPWVGAKQSGFGYHGTKDGHRQFAQIKIIAQR
jgi:aldehyde dehydrogenase (NAD+)/succinate-semialdehyde dehydrogenase/glutarate-semialdehyde dehydrogenase